MVASAVFVEISKWEQEKEWGDGNVQAQSHCVVIKKTENSMQKANLSVKMFPYFPIFISDF